MTNFTHSILFFTGVFLLSLFSSCDSTDEPAPNPISEPGEVGNIAEMNQKFSWDLFRELVKDNPGETVVYSPWSVQSALHMALNAAAENTLDEMLELLYCPNCPVEEINKHQAEMSEWLEKKSGHPTLTTANGFFYDDKRVYVKESFFDALKEHYRATDKIYDFNDPATPDFINNWVHSSTEGKIEEIIEQIDDHDLAFLINALYFKSDWAMGFDKNQTGDANFVRSDRTTLNVPFMNADRSFNHTVHRNFSAVDIPFRDSTYSLTLIGHNESDPGSLEWINELDEVVVRELYDHMTHDRIWLSFPKMELTFETDLPDIMEKLGMRDAFSETAANFSQLGQALIGPVIYINQMKHKAVLDVDEKGVEGAAVTSIGFGTTSAPPMFRYNQPFVMILRHIPSNTYVFQALVEDPIMR